MLHTGTASSAAARLAGLLALIVGLLTFWTAPGGAQGGRAAHVLHIDGAIGPATSDYVARSFAEAVDAGAALIVLRIDTPGGLDTSMREIIREILGSPVPVVAYVSPSGARAASAGTFILYASHVAAMAPGTNLGAATPVQIGGGGGAPPAEKDGAGNEAAAEKDSPLDRKAMNDAIAYIRSLAELRGRNADWAEAAVRSAASLSADAALEQEVIDLVARDMNALMRQLHGRTVAAGGREVTLDTRNLALVEIEPNWRTQLLSAITNPNVALILMLVGVYGLLFEFMNPGALYPGTIGAICLLVGLYALAALPVNYAGIGLILLGVALIAAEAFSPSFGVLGIGGTFALALGAAILIDTDVPQFRIGWPAAAGLAVASLAIVLAMARVALSARRAGVVSGREQMIGATGTVLDWEKGRGHVFVHGERWRATGVDRLDAGEAVRVSGLDGLTLTVEAAPAAGEPTATTEG
ncbi:MAG: nodulation protein NfeD [Pseudomonadota bacterium]|nr:nodulation protein NfeD [Pseudomonadota bacterium]